MASHFHVTTGRPCNCPWGVPDPNFKFAGEFFDQLKQRKKLQSPEAQALLQFLERRHVNDSTEKWIPWLLDRVRAKEMEFTPPDPEAPTWSNRRDGALTYTEQSALGGHSTGHMYPGTWQHWCNWLNSGHRTRRGVNPMQMNVQQLKDRVEEWQNDLKAQQKLRHRRAGEVVYQYPDGWTLRRLRAHELKDEGDTMGHCVGNYTGQVDNGDLDVLSLRDAAGDPHCTTGIDYEYVPHPGQLGQHYGAGDAPPLPEYDQRIRQYFESLPLEQRPLSDEGYFDNGISSLDEAREWMNAQRGHGEGTPDLDPLGLPYTSMKAPPADFDELHNHLTYTGYGRQPYFDPQEAKDLYDFLLHSIDHGNISMNDYVEKHLQPWQDKILENFDNQYYDYPQEVSHRDWSEPLVDYHPGANLDENGWRGEMERQEVPDTPENRQKYESDWEDADAENRDWHMNEVPEWQAASAMYKYIQPHWNGQMYADTPQPEQRQAAVNQRVHHHITYGHLCKCPWGGDDQERYGAVKEAAKIDWLKERPDMQDERGQEWIKFLELHGYAGNADKLLPWLTREWRKGRITPQHPDPSVTRTWQLWWKHPDETYRGPNSWTYYHGGEADTWNHLTEARTREWLELMEEMKKHRQGIDVMQHKVHELEPKLEAFREAMEEKKRANYGEVVHRFPDGWTVRRLQDKEEARDEGDKMGHCVASYGQDIEDGDTLIYSLRDHRNLPHATMEINPDHSQCPDCEAIHYRGQHYCACGSDKVPKPQIGDSSEVRQFYGKQDAPPLPEYRDRMNQWLEPHGLNARGFEPWWDDEYRMDGPDHFWDYVGYNNDYDHGLPDIHGYPAEGWYENEPDDYRMACSEAEEHGLDEPNLVVGDPDYHKILESLWDPSDFPRPYNYTTHQPEDPLKPAYRPQWADYLVKNADQMTHTDQLRNAVRDHVEEYGPDVDWDNEVEPHVVQTLNHVGSLVDPRWQTLGNTPLPTVHPNQGLLFHPNGQDVGWNSPHVPNFMEQQNFSKVAKLELPPLYYRWAFSPESGEVVIGHNQEAHPSMVRYHEDLSGALQRPHLVHGYAYRIPGGWRLTDWEHKAVDDPFVTSNVLTRLRQYDGNEKDPGGEQEGPTWEPAHHDFDQTHYGLPIPAE